ncbi:MAG: BON domain-containing protein [Gammaproteobacteria bacterium]|jgi:osmotically-inducible protein OsmY
MKRSIARFVTVFALAATLAAPLSGCVIVVDDEGDLHSWSIGHDHGVSDQDKLLANNIRQKFDEDDALKHADIDIRVDDAEVTLRGHVSNPALISQAVETAMSVDGVKKVYSRLSVVKQ